MLHQMMVVVILTKNDDDNDDEELVEDGLMIMTVGLELFCLPTGSAITLARSSHYATIHRNGHNTKDWSPIFQYFYNLSQSIAMLSKRCEEAQYQ